MKKLLLILISALLWLPLAAQTDLDHVRMLSDSESLDIADRGIMNVILLPNGQIQWRKRTMVAAQLDKFAKDFIVNEKDLPNAPLATMQTVHVGGQSMSVRMTDYWLVIQKDGIMSVDDSRVLSILHRFVTAIDDLRDDYAILLFGQPFDALTGKQHALVEEVYPYHIAIRTMSSNK